MPLLETFANASRRGWSSAALKADTGSFDLLETAILSSTTASVTFDTSTYAALGYSHLQARITSMHTATGPVYLSMRINGATTNYTQHWLTASDSSGVYSFTPGPTSIMQIGETMGYNNSIPGFSATVVDILDAFSTNKNKTVRSLNGYVRSDVSARGITLASNARFATDAITSLTFSNSDSRSFAAGSRFSIYGLKG